jgi:Adenylate kinase
LILFTFVVCATLLTFDPDEFSNFQFGKPGSGKGTLSAKLTTKYDVSQLSAGDLLRAHINEGYVMLYLPTHPASTRELN